MAIDATLKVKQINSINPYGDGWNRHMEIDIDSIELVECVKPEEIISEYTAASLLDAMDESDVVRWLENEGYIVTNDEPAPAGFLSVIHRQIFESAHL